MKFDRAHEIYAQYIDDEPLPDATWEDLKELARVIGVSIVMSLEGGIPVDDSILLAVSSLKAAYRMGEEAAENRHEAREV